MTEPTSLSERLVAHMVSQRPELERLMEQEGSRALHEEFILAEGGTLPDRQSRLTRARQVGARAWLRHLAAAVATEWGQGPPDLQPRLERWVSANPERLEALELEEQAAVEREGLAGDADIDARRVTLGAYMRLFAEGLGDIAGPVAGDGPDLGRRVAAYLRRESAFRRQVERESFAAWTGSPMEGLLEEARVSAAPPEPGTLRIMEAAAVWSYVRVTADALQECLPGAVG
ncbi:MAG: hypothetical protein U0Y82_08720 [Thermoleophilia bacterium]